VWQCRRTASLCEELERAGHGEYIRKVTGLRLDPYFSGTKLKWILDNVEGARERAEAGELLFGTVDTWIVWKLTDGAVFVTDRTNASRTMLCNIHTDDWDDGMLKLLGVPRSMLPEIKSSSEIYGYFECMGATVAISGIAGDQQAALFGQCCFERGSAKNTYGTGCFLLTNTGTEAVESRHGLLTTIIATEKDRPIEYALEGSVFVGGAVVQWLRDELHLINDSRDSEYFAKKAKDSGGVYVVPAFAGLGTPYWDMHARGSIFGLTRGTGANHIIRASLESIAYQTNDVLTSMQADMGTRAISKLKVDGGASANDLLMQMQADFSDIAVLRSSNAEATATGAAYLAGLAAGFWADRDELISLAPDVREFTPEIDADKRASLLDGWRRAVRACREFSKTEE
jgi:glycerol kinase